MLVSARKDFIVEDSHCLHHCGVNTTLYFAQQVDPEVSWDEADQIVKNCREHQSIDPIVVRIDGSSI